jgi:hypothetical protein
VKAKARAGTLVGKISLPMMPEPEKIPAEGDNRISKTVCDRAARIEWNQKRCR